MTIYIATHYASGNISLATASNTVEAEKFISDKLKQENVLFCELVTPYQRYGK